MTVDVSSLVAVAWKIKKFLLRHGYSLRWSDNSARLAGHLILWRGVKSHEITLKDLWTDYSFSIMLSTSY